MTQRGTITISNAACVKAPLTVSTHAVNRAMTISMVHRRRKKGGLGRGEGKGGRLLERAQADASD